MTGTAVDRHTFFTAPADTGTPGQTHGTKRHSCVHYRNYRCDECHTFREVPRSTMP